MLLGVQITPGPFLKPPNFSFYMYLAPPFLQLSRRCNFLLTPPSPPPNLGVNTYLLSIDLVTVIGPVGFVTTSANHVLYISNAGKEHNTE